MRFLRKPQARGVDLGQNPPKRAVCASVDDFGKAVEPQGLVAVLAKSRLVPGNQPVSKYGWGLLRARQRGPKKR